MNYRNSAFTTPMQMSYLFNLLCVAIITSFCVMTVSGSLTADQLNDQGVAFYEQELYEEALESFEQSLSLDSEHEPAWYNRGLALLALERYDDALDAFNRTLEINASDADTWHNIGVTLERMGHADQALEAYATSESLGHIPEQGDLTQPDEEPDDTGAVSGSHGEFESSTQNELQDREFDRLYTEHTPRISESLHQITSWISDKRWNEAYVSARDTAIYISEYADTLNNLQLSREYQDIRDTYVFFLKQLVIANNEISDIASLYPLYFGAGSPNFYSRDDNADYLNRLNSVIQTLGTAQKELERFSRLYS